MVWSFFTTQIKCAEHSGDSGNTIRGYGCVFTWEWIGDTLCLYLYSKDLSPPAGMARVYSSCTAATLRTPAKSLAGEFTAPNDSRLVIRNRKLYCGTFEADPDEHMGKVFVNGDNFYIVHGGIIGEELPSDIIGLPGVPFMTNVTCPLCVIDDNADSRLSDIEEIETPSRQQATVVVQPEQAAPNVVETPRATPGASRRIPQFPMRRREIIRSPVPPILAGNPVMTEWKDYWGTTYNKLQYDNCTVLRCRDTSVFATHTLTDEGAIEIYPDISTRLRSLKLATSSNPKACLYTHDDTGLMFCTTGTQVFLITKGRKLMVMRTPVIRSRTRLLSGQCIYYWNSGWTPYYGENMRVGSVVTIGRKIGDFYYYAVVNGSTQYFELNISVNGLWKVDHYRNRPIEKANFVASGIEIVKFKYNTMFRIVSADGKTISSWTENNTLDYLPWEFEYFALKRTAPSTATMGCPIRLEEAIYKSGGLWMYLRSLETEINAIVASGNVVTPVAYPMVQFSTTAALEDNSVVIRLVREQPFLFRQLGCEVILRGSHEEVSAYLGPISNCLWSKGFECITFTGDIELLTDLAKENMLDIFAGCEQVTTPVLIFASNKEAVMNQLARRLVEACPELAHNVIRRGDITIHSDWRPGAAKLRPVRAGETTLTSLKKWRSIQKVQPVELVFTEGRASAEAAHPDEICDTGANDWWAGEVMSALDSGTCFGSGDSLVSSYHVTHGNDVVITRAGLSYTWKDIFHKSADEDLIVYGSKAFPFTKAEKGEILCAVCPTRGVGKFLIVESTREHQDSRGSALFYELRPIEIDEQFNTITPSNWRGVQGMSGSPIINSDGKIVSVYGLGKIETRQIRSYDKATSVGANTALTILAPEATTDATPDLFFKTAVVELLHEPLGEDESYYLVEAPTGAGKTINFTSRLMDALDGRQRVYLLQPTVAAVRGAFEQLCRVLKVDSDNRDRYTICYTVGQQHAESTDMRGRGMVSLVIMSYGAAIKRQQELTSEANFILLDEVHCRSDPTVVAGDLQFTREGMRYKCVHLTATVLTRRRAKLLASSIPISGTRYPIDESFEVVPAKKGDTSDGDYWVIAKTETTMRHEGYPHGYKVPVAPLKRGRVIFFLATRNDCDRLARSAKKQSNACEEAIAIHGGTVYDPSSLPDNVWCFCTDVVGQAVTIPGCVAVVDFLDEMKPDSRLELGGDSLIYSYRLVRRVVGVATAKQRKGRTGRTNPGAYIMPRGIRPAPDYDIDRRTAAVALLELEAARKLNWDIVEEHHNEKLVTEMKSLRWLLPNELVMTLWWRRMHNQLTSDERVQKASGKKDISFSLKTKLELLRDINGDLLYLYLTPVISDELVLVTRTEPTRRRRATISDEEEWLGRYYDYVVKCKTEYDRSKILGDYNTHIESFVEEVSEKHAVSAELLTEIGLQGTLMGGEYITHNACSTLGGVAVAVGATAVMLSSIYSLTIKNLDRFVTRVFPFRGELASAQAKHLSIEYAQNPEGARQVRLISGRALEIVMQKKDALLSFFGKIGLPIASESQHSFTALSSVMAGASSLLSSYWAAIPVAYHVGAFPSLATIMGAGWIGSKFSALERVLGRALAVSVLAILNGCCIYFTTAPLAVTSCVVQVLGFVMNGLIGGAANDYDMYGRPIASSDRAWDLVFGIGAGIGVGWIIKNQLLVTAQVASAGFLTGTAEAALGVTSSQSRLFGASGNALVFVKQVYLIFTRVQDGKLPWNSMGAVITAVLQGLRLDITTAVLGVVVSIALIAIRTGLRAAKFNAGVSAKSARQPDGTNAYVEEFFGSFDKFALSVLSAGSCLASPSSIISVAIAWIGNCCRSGTTNRQNFTDAFEAYSGVPIAVAIISEGLVSLGGREGVRQDSIDIFTLALGVPSFIAGVFGCVYWAKNPTVVHALTDVWENIKGFLSFAWKFARDGFVRAVGAIGNMLGEGFVAGVTDKLPNWCRPAKSEPILEERFALVHAEPAIVDKWYHDRVKASRVSIIERLHYSRSINKFEHYGVMPLSSLVRFSKDIGHGVSLCRKYDSVVPFDFFCMTAEDLRSIITCFAMNVSINNNVVEIRRSDCHVTIEMAYTADVATHFVRVVKGVLSISFLVVSLRSGSGSTNYVLGYRVPKGLLDMLFAKLACLHPSVEALSGNYEDVSPESFALETNHLCAWSNTGISFSWHSSFAAACIGVVDKAANVFGLVNKVNENEFDLGLIPEAWSAKPDLLSTEEWEMYQWLLWSAYESGMMLSSKVEVLKRDVHLPARLLDCCVNLWRRVDDLGWLDVHSEYMSKHHSPMLYFSRRVDASDPAFRRSGGGYRGAFDLSNGLDGIDSWAHAAWWAGINVYYVFNDTPYICTLGGFCTCSAVILVGKTSSLGFASCPTHRNSWQITEGSNEHVDLNRGRQDSAELTARLNRVLDSWYAANPWRKGLSGRQSDGVSEDVASTKSWLYGIRRMWSSDKVVEHSESIIDDLLKSINNIYEILGQTKTTSKRKALSMLEEWNSSVVASEVSSKRAHIDERLAEIEQEEVKDRAEKDVDPLLYKHLLGYHKPNVGTPHGWTWLHRDFSGDANNMSNVSSTLKAGIATDRLASRLNKAQWLKMERLGRVELPKRSAHEGSYVSRGGFKMQQLHEADPCFFEEVKNVLDPCCGFGGFAEYYSTAMAKKAPKIYMISSLHEKGHRVPVGELRQQSHSNVSVVQLTSPLHEDRGNIKDSRCVARLMHESGKMGGYDLLIIDAGEYSSDGSKNRNFWLSRARKGESFLSAVSALIRGLPAGGKACIKVNGLWHGLEPVVHELTQNFSKVKAIKLGTTALASPEWYLLCSGYSTKLADMRRSIYLVASVCDEQRYHYLLMQQIMRVKGRGWRTIKRGDWYEPGRKIQVLETMVRADNKPPGLSLNIESSIGNLSETWDPKWDERMGHLISRIRSKKMRLLPNAVSKFDNICSAGTIARRRRSAMPKNTRNGLIADFEGRVWGLSDTNSTACHTQATDKWKESSIKKRLDVNPGQMDSGALTRIHEALTRLTSEYGKSVMGTCRLLTKEEVETMINAQGSTGALDDGHTLGEYMLLNPSWYDDAMELVNKWANGIPTPGYFTCRPKNEPKIKKCVEKGRIVVSDEESLKEFNEQGHRFIQFADALTRLAHYILLGDMLRKGSKQKLYKGTVNGTPPMYLGRVIRAMWDMNSEACNREIVEGRDDKSDVRYRIHSSEKLGGKGPPTAVCLDYSGWDTTVTLGERIIEADYFAKFYPSTMRGTIMNCFKETACPITVDDDGNIWLRAGQRGSGELMTSVGNTALVAANTAVAVAACTGLSIAEVCETVATLEYQTLNPNLT